MNPHLYVDVHILQDVPPSNINRDDSGTPKQATYGGANRLRVASQAWKRATRLAFRDSIDESQLGVRTRQVGTLFSQAFQSRGVDPAQADRLGAAVAPALEIGTKDANTQYLVFLSRPQVDQAVECILSATGTPESLDDETLAEKMKGLGLKSIFKSGHSLDVALFGRMVADMAAINVDAAAQVAHALSTHAVETGFDFFTAVDDLNENSKTGAGMMGTVEFNSATLYRYATVGVHQLLENLGDPVATTAGVVEFIRAFTLSMPAGHKTSFAPNTRPGFVSVIVRADQPVSFVSAFEKPVYSLKGTFEPSLIELSRFAANDAALWGDSPVSVAATYRLPSDKGGEVEKAFGPSLPFTDLLATVGATVDDWLTTNGSAGA